MSSPSQPLRVLWLIRGLGPGGAEQLLVNHARVAGEGFAYEAAYTVPWKNHLVEPLAQAGVPAHLIGSKHLNAIAWLPGLIQLLWTGRYDVVHAHSPTLAAAARVIARLMPRSRRPAVVSTEHNRWDRYSAPTRLVNRLTMPLGSAAIAVSEGVRESATPALQSHIEVLHHGIDLEGVGALRAQRDAVRREFGIAPDAVVAGTVANYRASKAYPDLLAAYRAALDEVPGLQVVIVGQGPLEDEVLRVHRELDLGDRVQLLGYQPDAARITAAFDMFVLASRQEGLPVAVMEALALGVPVISTAVGGLPEAVDAESGRLVDPAEIEALVREIVAVATDDRLRAGLSDGARRASRAFGMEPAARRLEAIYAVVARRG